MIHNTVDINIHGCNAKLTLYLIGNSKELYDGLLRPLVLICPGGAYAMTSDREAEGVALKYMAMGYHAAVLRYSTAPETHYPTALLQLAKSVLFLREHAEEWYIDQSKIAVAGFSAGGHLTACYGCFWKRVFIAEALGCEENQEMLRPNALILSYPVISAGKFGHERSLRNLLGEAYEEKKEEFSLEKQVNEDVPPVFLWATFEDGTVDVENSLLFVWALREKGILTEFHMFSDGPHGLGTAGKLTMSADGRGIQKECETWMELSDVWMQKHL